MKKVLIINTRGNESIVSSFEAKVEDLESALIIYNPQGALCGGYVRTSYSMGSAIVYIMIPDNNTTKTIIISEKEGVDGTES